MKTYQKQTDPMNKTYKSLPIIDIQPFINGSARRNVADQVIEACKEIGFLIIKGHEIEETVINDAFNASKSFFDLPQNIKNKWHPNEPSLQRGYHAFATRDYHIPLVRTRHLTFGNLFYRANRRSFKILSRCC